MRGRFHFHRSLKAPRAAEEAKKKQQSDAKKSASSANASGNSGGTKSSAAGAKNSAAHAHSTLERMATDKLEQKIEQTQNRIKAIDADLLDPATWRDQKKSNRLGDERQKLMAELEPLEFEWSRRAELA